jgi:predicted nucleic acid-binding protein
LPRLNRQIVADTGPLISLDACNQIQLLRELFSPVIVPREVARELSVGGPTGLPKGLTPSLRTWIKVKALTEKPGQLLLAALDDGEAAAIALAIELRCPRVLLDEPSARQVAQALGLNCIGSLGVLMSAKRQDLIAAVRPSIDLMFKNGIWLRKDLIDRALHEAGEEL